MKCIPTIALAAFLLTSTRPAGARADDCNGNGIADDIELSTIPDFVTATYAVGGAPQAAVTRSVDASGATIPFDVDGDGDTDLATADHGGGSVSILLNDGNGGFPFGATITTGGAPWSAEAGDIDDDGDPDLLVPDIDGIVHVLVNQGGGVYAIATPLTTGAGATGAAIADLDGDDDLDVAVSVQGIAEGLRLFFNAGDGTFGAQVLIDVDSSDTVVAADIDGDGDVDLATREGATEVRFLLNNGLGLFPFQATFDVGGFAHQMEFGDLDGDDAPDLVVSHGFGTSTVAVLMNAGGGAFDPVQTYDVGGNALHGQPVDLDGDGDLDLAISDQDFNDGRAFAILRNDGTGALGNGLDIAGNASFHASPADLDGDGDIDLVSVANGLGTAAVYLQDPLPAPGTDCDGNRILDACDLVATVTFAPREPYPAGDQPVSVIGTATTLAGALAPLDLNGDGGTDVAAVNENGSTLSVLLNQGSLPNDDWLGFAPSAEYDYVVGSVGPVDLAAGDLDGDGDQDIATVTIGTGFLTLFRNQGNGALDPAANTQQGDGLAGIVLADFDDDGDLDVAVSDEANDRIAIVENPGDASWNDSPDLYDTGALPRGIVAADLDDDGDIDLATTNQGDGSVTIRWNDGIGTFDDADDIDVGSEPFHLVAADLDGDGTNDLAVCDANNFGDVPGLYVLLNDGAGDFAISGSYLTGDQSRSVHAADLDGDGRCDLVVTNRAADSATVFMNAGGGSFAGATTQALGAFPGRTITADVDGDGGLDLISADQFDDALGVLLHQAVVADGDANGNGIVDACESLGGDIDGDGVVDVTDLLLILGSWGPCAACPADVNDDGVVDVNDLLAVLGDWS